MNKPKPMLAGIYVPLAAKFPVDVQPKLDGLRCMVTADDLVLRSRCGKTYTLPHIADQLAGILPTGAIADGELYIHGVPLQAIVSLVTRQQTMTGMVSFTSSTSSPATGRRAHGAIAARTSKRSSRRPLPRDATPSAS